MTDNLQQIVDEMRDEIRARGLCLRQIVMAGLPGDLEVEIIPDGVNSIVLVRCGTRELHSFAARPEDIMRELYVFLRACIKAARTPPPKPS